MFQYMRAQNYVVLWSQSGRKPEFEIVNEDAAAMHRSLSCFIDGKGNAINLNATTCKRAGVTRGTTSEIENILRIFRNPAEYFVIGL